MPIKYRAYADGKEITDFYIGGRETKQIWGGDTLLWEKSGEPPKYSLPVIVSGCMQRAGKYYELSHCIELIQETTNGIKLTPDNVEVGVYMRMDIDYKSKTFSSSAYMLCKPKTENIWNNRANIRFLYTEKDYSYDITDDNFEKMTITPSKIAYGPRTFTSTLYETDSYNGLNGIVLFKNMPFASPIQMPSPIIQASATIDGTEPLYKEFNDVKTLLDWASK